MSKIHVRKILKVLYAFFPLAVIVMVAAWYSRGAIRQRVGKKRFLF